MSIFNWFLFYCLSLSLSLPPSLFLFHSLSLPPSLSISLPFSLPPSSLELNEFVIQLDEEVDAMQSTILSLQQQLRELRDREKDSNKPAAANHSLKERTAGRHNGPIETSYLAGSSKAASRS